MRRFGFSCLIAYFSIITPSSLLAEPTPIVAISLQDVDSNPDLFVTNQVSTGEFGWKVRTSQDLDITYIGWADFGDSEKFPDDLSISFFDFQTEDIEFTFELTDVSTTADGWLLQWVDFRLSVGRYELFVEHQGSEAFKTITFNTPSIPTIEGVSNVSPCFERHMCILEPGVNAGPMLFVGRIVGDFNSNGVLDVGDVDLLADEIENNVGELVYDLNDDSIVDTIDLEIWINDLERTYFGDADLDGEFDSTDLVTVFIAGEYEDDLDLNSNWSSGDWNADREFDSSDFVVAFRQGGYEAGPRPAVAVPEPTASFVFPSFLVFVHLWLARIRLAAAESLTAMPPVNPVGTTVLLGAYVDLRQKLPQVRALSF